MVRLFKATTSKLTPVFFQKQCSDIQLGDIIETPDKFLIWTSANEPIPLSKDYDESGSIPHLSEFEVTDTQFSPTYWIGYSPTGIWWPNALIRQRAVRFLRKEDDIWISQFGIGGFPWTLYIDGAIKYDKKLLNDENVAAALKTHILCEDVPFECTDLLCNIDRDIPDIHTNNGYIIRVDAPLGFY